MNIVRDLSGNLRTENLSVIPREFKEIRACRKTFIKTLYSLIRQLYFIHITKMDVFHKYSDIKVIPRDL